VKARRADRSAPDDSDPDEIRSSSTFDYAVWLHDIRSGHNVGAVIRTAECFGFRRVYLSGFTPGPQQRSVQSAAMGCEEWIECRRLSNPEPAAFAPEISSEDPPALVVLESPNVVLPAKARRREIVCYTEYAWPAAAVLVVGNEELGVSQEVLSQADAIVTIPMYGRKASLNLASSFAIAAARARESRRE
jgi:tRNA G18 (ribose-2'-O)-methylase SpoU